MSGKTCEHWQNTAQFVFLLPPLTPCLLNLNVPLSGLLSNTITFTRMKSQVMAEEGYTKVCERLGPGTKHKSKVKAKAFH